MKKSHYLRCGEFVHMSPESQAAFGFVAAWPRDIYRLGAHTVCLRNIVDDPAPRISAGVLDGVALGVDIGRLLLAAVPSRDEGELNFKRMLFEDRRPLTPELDLLSLLCEASQISDEFRLGLRIGGPKRR